MKLLPYLTYMECFTCKNFFFIHEQPGLPLEITEPKYCPYCGTQFEYEYELEV